MPRYEARRCFSLAVTEKTVTEIAFGLYALDMGDLLMMSRLRRYSRWLYPRQLSVPSREILQATSLSVGIKLRLDYLGTRTRMRQLSFPRWQYR